MTAFGVHSEVGKLHKVMVHRPDLSLNRLTPSNHDDLLFDDVLWVERAQLEHDAFVAKMEARGVEVYRFVDLLGEAIAASEECRQRLIDVAVSEYTVGLSIVDEIRAVLHGLPADVLATHLVGGLTVAEAGLDLDKFREFSLPAAALDDTSAFVLPPGGGASRFCGFSFSMTAGATSGYLTTNPCSERSSASRTAPSSDVKLWKVIS